MFALCIAFFSATESIALKTLVIFKVVAIIVQNCEKKYLPPDTVHIIANITRSNHRNNICKLGHYQLCDKNCECYWLV